MHQPSDKVSPRLWQPEGLAESCREDEHSSSCVLLSTLAQQAVARNAVAEAEPEAVAQTSGTPQQQAAVNNANAIELTRMPKQEHLKGKDDATSAPSSWTGSSS